MRKSVLLGGTFAIVVAAAAFAVAPASAQWGGYGPGMMGGYGPGYGPGMMGGYGPGYGPGMMGGYGPGYGPGMMGGYGPGYGAGMMGGYGPGYGPGMMGPGYGPGLTGPGWGGDLKLSTDDVKTRLESWLAWRGNKRLKVGEVKAANDDTIEADIVTVDNSLVQKLIVNRHNGFIQPSGG